MPQEMAEIAYLPTDLRAALARGDTAIQLLGRTGRGKSTLLQGAAAWLEANGACVRVETLPEGARRYQIDLRGLTVFALDEADRLSAREWKRLLTAQMRQGFCLL